MFPAEVGSTAEESRGSNKMTKKPGTLYVVATPIGNLEDFSPRGARILGEVDLVAAEDTRHSARLLERLNLRKPMLSLHEHNEDQTCAKVLDRLIAGDSVALVSDAGTPLISDPGFVLVRACRQSSISVVPIPGPSAVITALSVSGLPTDRFRFEGFPPRTQAKRVGFFKKLRKVASTMVFYESSHRILECLEDMSGILGEERRAVMARELTKQYETVISRPLGELCDIVRQDPDQQRGEIVLVVAGAAPSEDDVAEVSVLELLETLAVELPPNKAAKVAASITGMKKNRLYELLMEKRQS